MLFVALSLEALLNYFEECQVDIDAIDVCGPPSSPRQITAKSKCLMGKLKNVYSLFKRQHPCFIRIAPNFEIL